MDSTVMNLTRRSPLSAIAALLAALLLAGPAARAADQPTAGEIIYVPIYSSVFYQDGKKTLELAAMLSIHNVDMETPITVTKVDYYNTKGEPIRKYLTEPLVLKPLETKNVVVEKGDSTGGTGANFLVEWQSTAPKFVHSPIVEALMISASSGQGISFTSAGRVIKRFGNGAP